VKRPFGGAIILLTCISLAACFAPLSTREAQSIASERLTKYCAGKCGAVTLGRTQRIKSRYLVDFDSSRQRFTVIVENDGNAKVTAWDKSVKP
jgi:very-short-patch-repair endonuclease